MNHVQHLSLGSEAVVLCRILLDYHFQFGGGGEILPRVKDFKYLWVLFTSDGETEREMVGRQQDCGEDLLVHICCMFKKKLHRQTVALNTVTDLLLLFR